MQWVAPLVTSALSSYTVICSCSAAYTNLREKGFATAEATFKCNISTDCVATAAANVNVRPSEDEEEQTGVVQSVQMLDLNIGFTMVKHFIILKERKETSVQSQKYLKRCNIFYSHILYPHTWTESPSNTLSQALTNIDLTHPSLTLITYQGCYLTP